MPSFEEEIRQLRTLAKRLKAIAEQEPSRIKPRLLAMAEEAEQLADTMAAESGRKS